MRLEGGEAGRWKGGKVRRWGGGEAGRRRGGKVGRWEDEEVGRWEWRGAKVLHMYIHTDIQTDISSIFLMNTLAKISQNIFAYSFVSAQSKHFFILKKK